MKVREPAMSRESKELLYQALETELGGVEVYRLAILCARHADLKEEWTRFLGQTERHVEIVRGVFERLGLDAEATTPGRTIVREKAKGLVAAMQKAMKDAPQEAQIVAAECVVDAETKDHANWELIGSLAEKATGAVRAALAEAHAQVEDEEDEHLYRTRGWCRELWLEALGLDAEIPPREERDDVKTAADSARVQERRKMQLVKKARSR